MTANLPSEQPRQKMANLSLSAIRHWLVGWLVGPAAAITDPDERREAQLISSILLLVAISFTMLDAFYFPYMAKTAGMDVWQGPFFYVEIGFVFALFISYGVSRTRFFDTARDFALSFSMFVVYLSVLLRPGYLNHETIIVYLILQFVLSSFFLTLRQLIGMALVHVVLTTLIAILSPQITFTMYLVPMPVILMMLVFTLLYVRYRDDNEQTRQAELKEALRHAETLYETGRAISSTLEREDVLTRVAEQMSRAIDATSAYISSYDPATAATTVLAEYVSPHASPAERISDLGAMYPETEEIEFLEILQNGGYDVDYVDDPHVEPSVKEHLERYGGNSILYIPLRIAKQLAGYVEVWDSRRRREFTPDEIALCQGIALHAALALENAHLYEQLQQHAADLEKALHHAEMLYETGRVISSTLEREDVLTRVSEQMSRAIDATSAYISSYDPITNTTTVLAEYIGPHANPAERVSDIGASYPETQGIEFLENMQTVGYEVDHIDDPHVDLLVKEHLEQYGGKSILYIPLRIAKQLVGYVEVWESRRRREFTPDEIALCQGIALHAALVLDNVHLYEQVQQHATILEERVAARTAELEAANERLQALSQVKDEFVSNVSHELRTPISNVKLYHHLLTVNPGKQDRYLTTLQRETQRLEQIVESLLHLSRLDRESVPLRPVSLDLNATAVQFVTDRLALARERGLTLKLDTDPALPRVLADPQQIGQALSIMLTNALNYTAAGGRVMVATHSRQLDGQQWVGMSVSDTGQGIPPDEQEHLFERFYRGKVGRESGLPGTGLGLAIIKEIVERHGGRVEVESEGIPGEGATFTLWLPVKK